MWRDTQSVTEFLQVVKVIIDELALIDVPLCDDNVVLHVFSGVGTKFKETMLLFMLMIAHSHSRTFMIN